MEACDGLYSHAYMEWEACMYKVARVTEISLKVLCGILAFAILTKLSYISSMHSWIEMEPRCLADEELMQTYMCDPPIFADYSDPAYRGR